MRVGGISETLGRLTMPAWLGWAGLNGRNRARTCDLPRVKRTLSQLSYAPWDGLAARSERIPQPFVPLASGSAASDRIGAAS